MAINFPDTPNEGDVHVVGTRSWTWDGTAWTSNTSRDYINSISETEPTNPVAGDTWFKSSTGQTFIYYDSYWIETGVAGPRGPAGTDGTDASLTRSIRTESADTTLLAADANQMLRFTGTDLQTLTIPDVLSVGESVQIVQDNTGQIEFSSGSGVTLLSDSGEFGSNGQNTKVDLVCVGAGEYRLYGELVAAISEDFVEYLIVAGGGSGGWYAGGGGGAGGFVSGSQSITAGTYAVTVGGGGASVSNTSPGNSGSDSSIATISTASGGGGGGGSGGLDGGSGGGSGNFSVDTGGTGIVGQGNDGGDTNGTVGGAGGGGASAVGQDGYQESGTGEGAGGNGGAGSQWLNGNYYAGGGGGSGGFTSLVGVGGIGGGGDGGGDTRNGSNSIGNGEANTGGGGGGRWYGGSSGTGGSGIVILRYPSDRTITIGSGLTGTTSTVGANKVTEITAGTGNISFS